MAKIFFFRESEGSQTLGVRSQNFGISIFCVTKKMTRFFFGNWKVVNIPRLLTDFFIELFKACPSLICNLFVIPQCNVDQVEDVLIMDRQGYLSYIEDWGYVHNRAFTIEIKYFEECVYVLLKE